MTIAWTPTIQRVTTTLAWNAMTTWNARTLPPRFTILTNPSVTAGTTSVLNVGMKPVAATGCTAIHQEASARNVPMSAETLVRTITNVARNTCFVTTANVPAKRWDILVCPMQCHAAKDQPVTWTQTLVLKSASLL